METNNKRQKHVITVRYHIEVLIWYNAHNINFHCVKCVYLNLQFIFKIVYLQKSMLNKLICGKNNLASRKINLFSKKNLKKKTKKTISLSGCIAKVRLFILICLDISKRRGLRIEIKIYCVVQIPSTLVSSQSFLNLLKNVVCVLK